MLNTIERIVCLLAKNSDVCHCPTNIASTTYCPYDVSRDERLIIGGERQEGKIKESEVGR